MAFLKRLGFYLIGFSIGVFFLAIFLKKKSEETGVYFCYLPNCRTLKDIRSKPLSYSQEIRTMLQNQDLDTVAIDKLLLDGDVDFGKSKTSSVPCKTYYVRGKIKERNAMIKVRNCEDMAIVESLVY
jgi:hypothetical protein